jgi:hypothetical protein
VYGAYSHFNPYSPYSSILIGVSLALSCIGFIGYLYDDYIGRQRRMRRFFNIDRPFEAAIFGTITSFSIPYLIICFYLPLGLHQLTKTPGEATFTITSKPYKYRDRYPRDGRVRIDTNIPMTNTVHDIEENLWDTLTPGDQLTLKGMLSPFGVSYSSVLVRQSDTPHPGDPQ